MKLRLSTEFWDAQKGLMLIGSDGSIGFSAAGREHYGPLFAKYGYALQSVTTRERFYSVMQEVTAGELEANTLKFEAMLRDPNTTPEERELIKRVLNPECVAENVLQFKPARM
jgi:hypothetical protein